MLAKADYEFPRCPEAYATIGGALAIVMSGTETQERRAEAAAQIWRHIFTYPNAWRPKPTPAVPSCIRELEASGKGPGPDEPAALTTFRTKLEWIERNNAAALCCLCRYASILRKAEYPDLDLMRLVRRWLIAEWNADLRDVPLDGGDYDTELYRACEELTRRRDALPARLRR